MLKDRILKFLSITISVGIAGLIFLNPITQGTGEMQKIELISGGLNEIIRAIGFSLKLNPKKVVDSVFFLEYMFFGISLMITTKLFCEKSIKNIFLPLFIGLLTSVLLVYQGYKTKVIFFEINSIMLMFKGLVIGVSIFLLLEVILYRFKLKKSPRKSRYKRGR